MPSLIEKLFRTCPRTLTPGQYLITLVLYLQCALIMGVAIFPSVYLNYHLWQATEVWTLLPRLLVACIGATTGYFLYAIVVIFVVAAVAFVLRLKVKEGRYYIYGLEAIKWANYNSLILIVRYTCMNFLRVTPFLILFYRMMGAKIGRNCQINTCIIGDCSALSLGDNVIIGGDVTLVAHVGEHDQLIVKPVKIGSNVTLGMMTIIMPGVEIGDNVMIAANTVLPKDKKIPPNTRWAGIPAKQLH